MISFSGDALALHTYYLTDPGGECPSVNGYSKPTSLYAMVSS